MSRAIGNSWKAIENGVNILLKKKFRDLRESRRIGRPSRLLRMMEHIGSDLRKGVVGIGYSLNLLDRKFLSHHIKLRYGINLDTRSFLRISRKLAFTLRKLSDLVP